ncbi:MAG: TetR/AcrR family transcriptional regulator [Eubacteriales bacterium]
MRQSKPDKRKVQGAETKRKLYGIADRLFSERGFSDVSIEDITDEAGVTKGAFYVHFASKDALISLLIEDYVSRSDTDYKAFLKGLPDDMPCASAMLALAGKIADTLSNSLGCDNMKKVYRMLLTGSAGTEAVQEYGRDLYALVRGILEKGLERGEFKSPLSPEALSRHFVMALRGTAFEWCVRYPDFDLREQTTEHIRLLLGGIENRTQTHREEIL